MLICTHGHKGVPSLCKGVPALCGVPALIFPAVPMTQTPFAPSAPFMAPEGPGTQGMHLSTSPMANLFLSWCDDKFPIAPLPQNHNNVWKSKILNLKSLVFAHTSFLMFCPCNVNRRVMNQGLFFLCRMSNPSLFARNLSTCTSNWDYDEIMEGIEFYLGLFEGGTSPMSGRLSEKAITKTQKMRK